MRKIGSRSTSRQRARGDKEISDSFLELFRSMKCYVREEIPPFSEKGLSEEKIRCLGALRFLGKSHLKSLAAYDGLSASSQCIMLTQLVRDGLVVRSDDPADRRNVFYELTDPGLELVNTALAGRVEFLCERLAHLSQIEKAHFASALAVVLSTVDKLTSMKSAV